MLIVKDWYRGETIFFSNSIFHVVQFSIFIREFSSFYGIKNIFSLFPFDGTVCGVYINVHIVHKYPLSGDGGRPHRLQCGAGLHTKCKAY